MSFILDALKKSEAERQRQSGPALMEVRLVPPRRRFPAWWIALGVLLVGNVGLLLWLGLRKPTAAVSAPPPVTSAAAIAAPVAAPAGAPAAAPLPAAPAPIDSSNAAAPPVAAMTAPAASDNTDLDAVAGENPSDLEPARAPSGSVRRESAAQNLRNYSELNGSLPDLRLDLHVYAAKPADRYALINMHKVREGDVLPEGPRVSEITRDGVVLNYRGDEFLLGRD
jgi:general secretion pathway protein B